MQHIFPPFKKGEVLMGMIRNHLKEMKCKNPLEYKRLMEGYKSEKEFIHDICGLSLQAIDQYFLGGKRHGKRIS